MVKITALGVFTYSALLSASILLNADSALASKTTKQPDFEMVVQNKHSASVDHVAFTPDGKFIISGDSVGVVKLWNSEGRLIRTLGRNFHGFSKTAFSPDGKYIASGGNDGKINVWNLNGELVRTYDCQYLRAIAFSPDGKHLVAGTSLNEIKIWDMNGTLVNSFKIPSSLVEAIIFTADGKNIITGALSIQFWGLDGTLKKSFPSSIGMQGVRSLSLSPDGKYLVSSDNNSNRIRLWYADGRLIKVFNGYGMVPSVAFSPDSKHFISGSSDAAVRLWDIGGSLIRTFKGPAQSIQSVAFSPDGKQIVSGSWDQTIRVWSTDGSRTGTFAGRSSPIHSVTFTPDGSSFAYASDTDNLKFSSLDGKLLTVFKGDLGKTRSFAFSPDGKYIASAGYDNTVKLVDRTGTLIRTFTSHSAPVLSVAFSPDGKHIVSGSYDQTVKLWNVSGILEKTFRGHSNSVGCVAFNSDGEIIASGSADRSIILWRTDGTMLKTLHGHSQEVHSVSFSSNGKYLLSTSHDRTVKLWGKGGNLIRTFEGHSSSGFTNYWDKSAVFSPDGKYIASAARDNTIKLWDLNGSLIKTLKGPPDWATSLSFSPDGRYLASGTQDGIIKIRNLANEEYYSYVTSGDDWVMYTPDGYFDSSRSGAELINMVQGSTAYSIDQFAIMNNRPDLILERMGIGTGEQISRYNMLHQKRLKLNGLSENTPGKAVNVPEAKITDMKIEGKYATVTFSLSDAKHLLKRYNFRVNGVPLFGLRGRELNTGRFSGAEKIELSYGRNKIELTAINETGAESYRALVYAAYDNPRKGDLYYLAFGASKYKDKSLNLSYADKDASDLKAVISKMGPDYSALHVKTYLNAEVTAENVKNAKDFLKDAKTDDTVILFIAGHGGYDKTIDPRYYYLPYEADLNDLPATGINFDTLEGLLNDIKPRKKMFLIDTCESGELDEELYAQYYATAEARGLKPRTSRKPMRPRGKADGARRAYLYEKDRFIYNNIFHRSGTIVLSSSRGGELSYESTLIKNGFFTKELIAALTSKTADKNSDEKIDSGELRDFVAEAVARDTGGLQNPTVDRDNLYQKVELPLFSN